MGLLPQIEKIWLLHATTKAHLELFDRLHCQGTTIDLYASDGLDFIIENCCSLLEYVDHTRIQKIMLGGGGGGGGSWQRFLSHQHISQRAVQTSLQKQLDRRGPIASVGGGGGGGSVPIFLRKSIATCDFLDPPAPPPPPPPPGSAHVDDGFNLDLEGKTVLSYFIVPTIW